LLKRLLTVVMPSTTELAYCTNTSESNVTSCDVPYAPDLSLEYQTKSATGARAESPT
jgi:hypothetical protein